MVDTSRWPKAAYSVLRTACRLTPSCAACSRLTSSRACSPLSWASLVTSWNIGSARIARSSLSDHSYSDADSTLCSTYW